MLDALIAWTAGTFGDDWGNRLAYLTNGKHLAFYASVRFTLIAAVAGAAVAVFCGLLGAAALRSPLAPLRWLGTVYTTMVRGIPDVLFFLFLPLAFEQTVEWFMAQRSCAPEVLEAATRWPPCREANWFLTTTDYLALASVTLGIVYGAFAANVINGAMTAVPRGQLEAASAYGFNRRQVFWRFQVRQMWVYALPGLSNVWMLLLKATSLLSLLQIQDMVLWANRIGAPNFIERVGPVHGDWRWRYYLALFVFYILLTLLSEHVFKRLQARASRGLALGVTGVEAFLQDVQLLARPALFNIYFALASIPFGFPFAVLLALGKASGNRLVSLLCRGYLYAFRGSPLFIQFFMIYSVMLAFNLSHWKPMGIDHIVLHPLFLGPLVLVLNTSAYAGEIFHGALKSVPRGQLEAARAVGMSRWQTFRSVTWPNLIRLAWPAYTNEVVFLFHATALVYFTLPVIDDQQDLMNKAGELFERDYNVFLHYSVAALYFLAISFAIFLAFNAVYRRLTAHLAPSQRTPMKMKPQYVR